ncbi:hypothetical protein QBC47DRAFT_382027 [Echria macrotheca]|uniref:HIT-type domain-containing protein n=1 Tax=Echria macrotheca TaxID=438768 RepID=A0AAJ0F906_9PEZI|nr:hypothetical protein QBC47DRAFT_382027 [Echria macrotheca]
MNNFGVIEVASTKTTRAPGWAYVPDVGPSGAQAALPTNRKRAARNQSGLSLSDASARQDAKIRKDLEALDRDTHKDVVIPIPTKGGRNTKHTPNVRKILQSQKTFANHLDDYQALVALAETNPAAAAALHPVIPTNKPSAPPSTARNSPAPAAPTASSTKSTTTQTAAASRRSAAAAKRAAAKEAKEAKEAKAKEAAAAPPPPPPPPPPEDPTPNDTTTDTEMTDAPPSEPTTAPSEPPPQQPQSYPPDGTILPAYQRPPPPSHPGDDDPLLVSVVPTFPTDEELRALMTALPLNYLEARAEWGDEEGRYPTRTFCEVCGYWGRVRCIKCGARVCALDCLEAHREECVTRYGL